MQRGFRTTETALQQETGVDASVITRFLNAERDLRRLAGSLRWLASEPSTATTEQSAAEFTAKVIKVIDGDTIDVLTDDKETIRVRLNGIDAPERGQPFGKDATIFLGLIAGRTARIETLGEDR